MGSTTLQSVMSFDGSRVHTKTGMLDAYESERRSWLSRMKITNVLVEGIRKTGPMPAKN